MHGIAWYGVFGVGMIWYGIDGAEQIDAGKVMSVNSS